MVDGLAKLSALTGVSRTEMETIWLEVKANRARLKACEVHRFPGGKIEKLGDKYTCENCGGTQSLSDIGCYIDGYKAAGRDPEDVWPEWK